MLLGARLEGSDVGRSSPVLDRNPAESEASELLAPDLRAPSEEAAVTLSQDRVGLALDAACRAWRSNPSAAFLRRALLDLLQRLENGAS
jgi:hypothetical protein